MNIIGPDATNHTRTIWNIITGPALGAALHNAAQSRRNMNIITRVHWLGAASRASARPSSIDGGPGTHVALLISYCISSLDGVHKRRRTMSGRLLRTGTHLRLLTAIGPPRCSGHRHLGTLACTTVIDTGDAQRVHVHEQRRRYPRHPLTRSPAPPRRCHNNNARGQTTTITTLPQQQTRIWKRRN